MNILISGGTGFIGSNLCSFLLRNKHHIVVLTRRPETVKEGIRGVSCLGDLGDEEVFDVVINLAGEPIADKRWSDDRKKRISDSRLEITEKLIDFFKVSKIKPKLFISGSAIGYYGIAGNNEVLDESELGDESFSSQLCQQWEAVANQAASLGVRTCVLRTGIVLGDGGGALKKMLLPFKLGLGGKIGVGSQWMSWIHIEDLVGIISYCIDHDGISGPVNGTAPNPVTNSLFTKVLGKALNRPTIFPMPSVIVRLLMGQMGQELLLEGKRVLPTKISNAGYTFKYTELEGALSNVV